MPIQIDEKALAARLATGEATMEQLAEEVGLRRRALSSRMHRARRAGRVPDWRIARIVGEESPAAAAALAEAGAERPKLRETTLKNGTRTVESWPSQTIRSLPDLLEATETDPERWSILKTVLNNWPVTMKGPDLKPITVEMLQVKAWLEPRFDIVDTKAIAAALLEEMRDHAPSYRVPDYGPADPSSYMLEIAAADVHIGDYGAEEEGGGAMDLRTAEMLLPAAVDALIARARASYPIGQILLFLGGDILHFDRMAADGSGSKTTKGTTLDAAGRPVEVIRAAIRSCIASIDRCRLIAPVKVVVRPGNHDELLLFAIGETLAAWYRNDEAVEIVNDGHAEATVVSWGSSVLGLLHGHKAKDPRDLAMMLMDMAPEAWAGATWREIHRGHTHGAKVKDLEVDEVRRVRVRTVPALCVDGAWAAGMGWRHIRAAEAYLWGGEPGDGMVAMFSTTAGELERRGMLEEGAHAEAAD